MLLGSRNFRQKKNVVSIRHDSLEDQIDGSKCADQSLRWEANIGSEACVCVVEEEKLPLVGFRGKDMPGLR